MSDCDDAIINDGPTTAPIDRPWEQPCAECGRFHSCVSPLRRLKAAFPAFHFIGPKPELNCYGMHAVNSTADCVVLTVEGAATPMDAIREMGERLTELEAGR